MLIALCYLQQGFLEVRVEPKSRSQKTVESESFPNFKDFVFDRDYFHIADEVKIISRDEVTPLEVPAPTLSPQTQTVHNNPQRYYAE